MCNCPRNVHSLKCRTSRGAFNEPRAWREKMLLDKVAEVKQKADALVSRTIPPQGFGEQVIMKADHEALMQLLNTLELFVTSTGKPTTRRAVMVGGKWVYPDEEQYKQPECKGCNVRDNMFFDRRRHDEDCPMDKG